MNKKITISVHFCEECPRFEDNDCKCSEDGHVIKDKYEISELCQLEDE